MFSSSSQKKKAKARTASSLLLVFMPFVSLIVASIMASYALSSSDHELITAAAIVVFASALIQMSESIIAVSDPPEHSIHFLS